VRVGFVALGCPKNIVDAEKMLAEIAQAGYLITSDAENAEVVIINTCGFIAPAKAEALEEIARAVDCKQRGSVKKVIVTGCLPERLGQELFSQADGIDAIVGLGGRQRIAGIIKKTLASNRPAAYTCRPSEKTAHNMAKAKEYVPAPPDDRARLRITPAHWAYLRISEGCSHRCSFCTVPAIRGRFRSKPKWLILAEAEELVSAGAVELNIIAQDTTCYGVDLSGISLLGDLLTRLADVDGIHWIRLLYCHPDHLTQDMIDVVREEEKVVKYLDLPVQHFSTQLLRSMQRARGGSEISDMIAGLRTAIPGLTLRTSVLVGYPGEGPGEFEGLCSAVRELTFDHLGVFIFSPQEGTEAATLPDQVPEHVREARRDRLMSIQQEIAFVRSRSQVGKVVEVLVDRHFGGGADDRHGGYSAVGRTAGDAPEIDGVIYLRGAAPMPGEFCQARITDGLGYDLAGEVISRQQDP